jgi:hypothetical protein
MSSLNSFFSHDSGTTFTTVSWCLLGEEFVLYCLHGCAAYVLMY